jgi:hypothetical protein
MEGWWRSSGLHVGRGHCVLCPSIPSAHSPHTVGLTHGRRLTITPPLPSVFVSVDSKRPNTSISLLYSTLTTGSQVLILRGLRCIKIVQIRPGSNCASRRVEALPQKEKREASSRFVDKLFSKLNFIKKITKVKKNSGVVFSVWSPCFPGPGRYSGRMDSGACHKRACCVFVGM